MTTVEDMTDAADLPVSVLTGEPVACIAADATLLEVARELTDRDVGALVVGDPGAVQGVVSERDVVRALAAGRDPGTTRAAEVAHTDLVWCDTSSTVAEVAAEMMERYVRHVLVQEGGRLVGVVSARDLLGVYASAEMDLP